MSDGSGTLNAKRRSSIVSRRVVLAALAVLATSGSRGASRILADRRDLIGAIVHHRVVAEDTLADLAILYGVGFAELVAANPGIDPWLPPPGVRLVIPRAHVLPDTPRVGIVVNLGDQRLYLFRPRRQPLSFPIGIGTEGATLRTGVTHVVAKRSRPTWLPPPSLRAEDPEIPASVPPGPDNPLGAFALVLGWPRIVIHGTNRPYGVGRRVSHGCVRLHDAHVAVLHRIVPMGTAVRFVDQGVKLGWHDDELHLEIHPTLAEVTDLEDREIGPREPLADLDARVRAAAGDDAARVDWFAVRLAETMRTGVPVPILRRAPAP